MLRRIGLVVVFTVLSSCSSTKSGKAVDPDAPLRERLSASPAPEPSLSKGAWLNVDRPLRFSDELKGRVVLLAFWTTASISCTHTLPALAALEARFRDQPFTLVGVHTGKFDAEHDASLVRAAMARAGVSFPVVMDNDYLLWAAYGAQSWPTLALVDSEGFVVAMEAGEPDARVLEFAINNLLKDGGRRGVLAKGPPSWKAEPPPGSTSPLAFPSKVAALEGGRFAVSDTGHHRVLVFTTKGELLHVIGSGRQGLAEGPFASAAFNAPQGLAAQGEVLFVADSGNHVVRKVDLAQKTVSTVAGTGELGRGQRELKGPGPTVALRSPWDVALAGDFLVIATAGSNQLHRYSLSKGSVEPWVGAGVEELVDGPPDKASFARPSGLGVAGAMVIVADSGNSAVRQVHVATGEVTTLVGTGLFTFGDVDGARADARLQYPLSVAALGDAVFVADTYNGKVKRLSRDGAVATLAKELSRPQGVAVVGDRLLVAETDAHRLVWVDPKTGAVEPLSLSEVPAPATGLERKAFALKRATVKRGACTVRLLISAPQNESFPGELPVTVTARANGATPRGQPTWKVDEDEVQLDVPLDATSPGELSVEVDLYTRPKGKEYTRVNHALLTVPLAVEDGASEETAVPARIK
ncbi:MAG: redoxin family protein [Myxococcota bacterium]